MLKFTSLNVTDIQRETADSVSLGFKIPAAQIATFSFRAGQFLTLKTAIAGTEIRRAYSLCVSPAAFAKTGELRVAVKAVRDGKFSNWANESLREGDALDVLPPDGNFTATFDAAHKKHYVAFAGGSGITPMLSLITEALTTEPKSEFTLVYGNRSVASIMFIEALTDLKNRYVDRFTLMHVLSDEPQEVKLFEGLLNREKCAALLTALIPVAQIDLAFICGPEPMMDAAEAALLAAGLPASQIRIERFGVPMPASISAPQVLNLDTQKTTVLHIIADGTQRKLAQRADQSVLDAGLLAGMPLPYACKAGVCCTCKAKLIEGQVKMIKNFTLSEQEKAQGFVLTCQSIALTEKVVVSYDER